MKRILITTAAIFAMASFTLADTDAPTRPAGWEGALWHSKCDPDQYTPIMNDAGTDVLYWNNPTCVTVTGGGQKIAPPPPPEEEEEEEEEPTDPCACLPVEEEISIG